LRLILITGPVGFVVAILMFMAYSSFPDGQNGIQDSSQHPRKIHVAPRRDNPLKPQFPTSDLEAPKPLPMMVNNAKEPIELRYYHFVPIVRYYMVIKDGNPSDVEGLFRVNSLSSFTLGIAQICGILFSNMAGGPLDVFVKINIASQAINWAITLLYFGTSISARMKASFKVETLLYNSTASLRAEYESYLNCTEEGARQGGGAGWKSQLVQFHDSVNFEISEYVKQEIDLSAFSMEEKYKMRQAIRKKMYMTYQQIR